MTAVEMVEMARMESGVVFVGDRRAQDCADYILARVKALTEIVGSNRKDHLSAAEAGAAIKEGGGMSEDRVGYGPRLEDVMACQFRDGSRMRTAPERPDTVGGQKPSVLMADRPYDHIPPGRMALALDSARQDLGAARREIKRLRTKLEVIKRVGGRGMKVYIAWYHNGFFNEPRELIDVCASEEAAQEAVAEHMRTADRSFRNEGHETWMTDSHVVRGADR